MAVSLAILPAELLKNIFQRTLPTDLSNLWLVSWRLENVATEERFRQYTVRATITGVSNLKQVLATNRLKSCVKHLKWTGLVPVPVVPQDVCQFSRALSITNASTTDFLRSVSLSRDSYHHAILTMLS